MAKAKGIPLGKATLGEHNGKLVISQSRLTKTRIFVKLGWKLTKFGVRKGWAWRRKLTPVYVAVWTYLAGILLTNTPDTGGTVAVFAVIAAGCMFLRGRPKKRNWRPLH